MPRKTKRGKVPRQSSKNTLADESAKSRRRPRARVTKNAELVLAFIRDHEKDEERFVNRGEILDSVGLNDNDVSLALRELHGKGYARQVGPDEYATYERLKDPHWANAVKRPKASRNRLTRGAAKMLARLKAREVDNDMLGPGELSVETTVGQLASELNLRPTEAHVYIWELVDKGYVQFTSTEGHIATVERAKELAPSSLHNDSSLADFNMARQISKELPKDSILGRMHGRRRQPIFDTQPKLTVSREDVRIQEENQRVLDAARRAKEIVNELAAVAPPSLSKTQTGRWSADPYFRRAQEVLERQAWDEQHSEIIAAGKAAVTNKYAVLADPAGSEPPTRQDDQTYSTRESYGGRPVSYRTFSYDICGLRYEVQVPYYSAITSDNEMREKARLALAQFLLRDYKTALIENQRGIHPVVIRAS